MPCETLSPLGLFPSTLTSSYRLLLRVRRIRCVCWASCPDSIGYSVYATASIKPAYLDQFELRQRAQHSTKLVVALHLEERAYLNRTRSADGGGTLTPDVL